MEAADNPIRAIFTVDRLTEGWDVLNLFDIVRLYEGQNAGGTGKKTPAATVSEKQLIGRGVRYFPFSFEDKQKNKRKFDHDLSHELRVLEELFYYTHDERSRYISELKAELRKDGFIAEQDNKELATFALKPEFAQDESFKNLLIWVNSKIENPHKKQNNAESLQHNPQTLIFNVHSQKSLQEVLFKADEKDDMLVSSEILFSEKFRLPEIDKRIFDKALHIKGKAKNSLFHFNNLHEKLAIDRRDDLQQNVLRDWAIEFIGLDAGRAISPDDQLAGCLKILDNVQTCLNAYDTPFIGTSEFTPKKLWDIFGKPKQKWISKNAAKPSIAQQHNWYVLDNFVGTELEEQLINFISNKIGNLQEKYDVKLLRNEEVLKLANFANGEGFMPDFILLLKSKQSHTANGVDSLLHYQIFIEPKGEHLLEKDAWKQDFLNAITKKYGKDNLLTQATPHYRLIGLPFFTTKENSDFIDGFGDVLQNP